MLVSVIVPIYNSADTISSCIESILSQSLTNLELILVDDGSTDGSGDICDRYALQDDRIKIVHQQNKGRTEARYVGVKQAKAAWVAFVDSDDALPHSALSLLYSHTTDDVDIVFGNGYTLTPENRPQIPMADFRHLAVRAEGTIGVPWGSLYRRSLLTAYLFDLPRHIINGEDYIFWLRLVFSTHKPVSIVYDSVYDKGPEHTSNSFRWTPEYGYELNELRKNSIPSAVYNDYLADSIDDRMANMFSIAVCCKRQQWQDSKYYQELLQDMKRIRQPMPFKRRLFFLLPSIRLRKLYSFAASMMKKGMNGIWKRASP